MNDPMFGLEPWQQMFVQRWQGGDQVLGTIRKAKPPKSKQEAGDDSGESVRSTAS
jgi:hypothetical protein